MRNLGPLLDVAFLAHHVERLDEESMVIGATSERAMVGPPGQPTVYCCQFPHPFGGGLTGLKRPPAAPNPRNLYAHENTVPLTGDYLQRRAHIPSPG